MKYGDGFEIFNSEEATLERCIELSQKYPDTGWICAVDAWSKGRPVIALDGVNVFTGAPATGRLPSHIKKDAIFNWYVSNGKVKTIR